ncbi:MAG TPA: BamA/TamA family outer membrane protein [Gemmatimonadaceae bacterium]|nr:BamA/TamA family outer membrane protein [Gemmatimonadaceae bacterium]
MKVRTLRRAVAATLFAAPMPVVAQDLACDARTDVEVRHLQFSGNRAFGDFVLANAISTEQSAWTRRWFRIFGRKRCLDSTYVRVDAARLQVYYNQRGYLEARVTPSIDPPDGKRVTVRFNIVEGEPIRLDTLQIAGLDSIADRSRVVASLPLRKGDAFDQLALAATMDSLRRRLSNNGYPAADVFRSAVNTDSAKRRASVYLEVVPGTRARIGTVRIDITPRQGATQQISHGTVRRVLGVKEGDLYSESRIERGWRNLYLTEAYASTEVRPDTTQLVPPGDSLITLNVRLTEDFMRSARASPGWGTLDCFRAQGEFQHNNFLRDARRLDARARVSKIGIGRPLSGASGLCAPALRKDPYSEKLNYYTGVTVSDRTTSLWGMRPSVTAYSEVRGEYFAFLRTTPVGGLFNATRESEDGRRSQNYGYQLEYGRTEAQPAIFCALFNLCVPEDRDPVLQYRRLAVLSWAARKDWTDDNQFPRSGGVANIELRHASSAVGSDRDLQFSRATGDVALYASLGSGIVLATRLRAGVVVGPAFLGTSRFIPPQERLFAGGATSVRGFTQNDLGPKVYIASGYDTIPGLADTVYFRARAAAAADRSVPAGGSALVVANVEFRVPSPLFSNLLHLTFFTDAGELWSPGAPQQQNRFRSLKVTPGVGVRLATFVGLIGVDVAYNPYPPRTGAAFFDTPVELGGQLFCVSPDNTLAVTGIGGTPVQATGACPATFQPPQRRGFLRKLNLVLAIGHAF